MNKIDPIYTEKTECQDCYKCVRHCPVKAITVEDGSAVVDSELCIFCGKCVEICPVGAKRIRLDLSLAKQLLKQKDRVYVSLAPSYVTEYPDIHPSQLIQAIKRLGFRGVSETAIGAQLVSDECLSYIESEGRKFYISSACPVTNNLISKYFPDIKDNVTAIMSPVLAHCTFLKQHLGDDIGIVFISPCIAKKQEADSYPDVMDVSITFRDLNQWFEEEQIKPEYLRVDEAQQPVPFAADDGAYYPIDGGMSRSMKAAGSMDDIVVMTFSGIRDIKDALKDIEKLPDGKTYFIEVLACEGGCVNGPCSQTRDSTIVKNSQILNRGKDSRSESASVKESIKMEIETAGLHKKQYTLSQLHEALLSVGKYSTRDELNCGGCGYNSCKEFAAAMIDGKAEKTMCVSYMRKLATKKANALMQAMPSGVVIVDKDLRIVDCNKKFVELVGGDAEFVYEANPGLEGAYLKKLIDFHEHFSNMFNSDNAELTINIKNNDKYLNLTLFNIEDQRLVGGIIQDITTPYIQRDHVILKAKEVIRKNLTTVQQIAFLLGENASESEVMLQEIIDSFGSAQHPRKDS